MNFFTMTTTRQFTFFFVLLCLIISDSFGFVSKAPAFTSRSNSLLLQATTDPSIMIAQVASQLPTNIATIAPSFWTASTNTVASMDPFFGAEVLAGMAHVALDFTGMLSPSKSIIRAFSVVGRVFAISADYLPDHSIHTEELMIQIFLMGIAMKDLVMDKVQQQSQTEQTA